MNPFIGDIDKKVSIGDAVEAVLTSYGINPMRVEGRLPVDGTAKYMFRLLLIGYNTNGGEKATTNGVPNEYNVLKDALLQFNLQAVKADEKLTSGEGLFSLVVSNFFNLSAKRSLWTLSKKDVGGAEAYIITKQDMTGPLAKPRRLEQRQVYEIIHNRSIKRIT